MPRELKAHKIREMSPGEVRRTISDLREKQFKLRFQNAMNQLDNPLELRNVRRDIAVLKTVLSEHESGIRPLQAKDEA